MAEEEEPSENRDVNIFEIYCIHGREKMTMKAGKSYEKTACCADSITRREHGRKIHFTKSLRCARQNCSNKNAGTPANLLDFVHLFYGTN